MMYIKTSNLTLGIKGMFLRCQSGYTPEVSKAVHSRSVNSRSVKVSALSACICLLTMLMLTVGVIDAQAGGVSIPLGSALNVNTGRLNVAGDITNAGTLLVSTGTVTLDGNWVNAGTFTCGSGTVNFTATSGTQTLNSGGIGSGKLFYHLIHSGPATLQLVTNQIEIDGNFSNLSGNFNTQGLTINIAGSWTNSATFTHSSAQVIFDGSSGTPSINSPPGNGAFYDLSFQATAITYTLNSALTIERDLVVNSGILDAGTNDITVGGNWNVHNTNGGFISSGTVIFNGSAKQILSSGGTDANHDFQNLTHSGSGELELDPNYNLAVIATLTQSGAGDFDTQAKNITAGVLTISAGSFNNDRRAGSWDIEDNTSISLTATLSATSGNFNIAGNFSNSGTFIANNSTIIFDATSGTPFIDAPVAGGAFNNIIFDDSASSITFSLNSAIKLNNNLSIISGTLNANSNNITVGGSWDNNAIFIPGNSTITFDSSSLGKIIEAGTSSFYNIVLNNAFGGWTIQADALVCSNNFTLSAAGSFALSSGITLEVKGQFSNYVGGILTTWTGSVLYLNGTGSYSINNKTDNGDDYATLQIGPNRDIRMWNSSASTYTINSAASLYSMDHAGTNGDLYIWGDYNVREDSTDYWSYATDFDGTVLSGGGERLVNVRLSDGARVSCGVGETLQIIGASGFVTAISRQSGGGTYSIDINNGTINANYYGIEYIDGNGLEILGSSVAVQSLNNGSFDNNGGNGGSDTFIRVAGVSINNNSGLVILNVLFDNTNGAGDYNVTATGASTSFWDFQNSTGTFDGEAYDSDPGGDPGYLVWDDSSGASINISGIAYTDDNETTPVLGARVSLAVNNTYNSFVTTAGDGSFGFSGISVGIGDILTFYFDDEAFVGSTVTITNGTNISNLRIYPNHVVVGHNFSAQLSISQMANYDKTNDPDINFDATDASTDTLIVNDGSELFISPNFIFQPVGNLESGTSGIFDLDIRGSFICIGEEIMRVSGFWTNSGTFSAANSLVKFDASSGTPSINAGASPFYNLIFIGTSTFNLANNLSANNLTLASTSTLNISTYALSTSGTLSIIGGTLNGLGGDIIANGLVELNSGTLLAPTAGKTFTVRGNWSNTGAAFISGSGKVGFNKTSGIQTINAGGCGDDNKDFNNLEKSGAGTLQLVSSGLEVDGALTISSLTSLDLNGCDLNLGTLDNSGIMQMLGSESQVTITNMDIAKGEVIYVGDGDGTPEIFTVKNFGALDYYNLTINDTHTTKDTFRTAADLGVNAELKVLAGELDISFNGNNLINNGVLNINGGTLIATSGNIDANSDVTLSSGSLTAPSSGQYFRIAGSLGLSSTFSHSSGEITFDATAGNPTINSGANNLYNLAFNDAGNIITFSLNSDITVNNLNIISGSLDTQADRAITIGGNWSNSGNFVSHNSIVTFNKSSGIQTIDAGGTGNNNKDFQTLTKTGSGTLQLINSGLEVDGTLTVSNNTTLDLNGKNLNAGILDNSGTLQLQGGETVNVITNDTNSGLIRYVGDGDVVEDTFNISGFSGSQYYNLSINDTHTTKDIFQTTEDVVVYSDLTVNGGRLTAINHNIVVSNNFNLASGTCNAPGLSKTLTVAGDFMVAGTFNPGLGRVSFNDNTKLTTLDAPGGGITFNNFNCSTSSKVLNFTQSDTFVVSGLFSLDGGSSSTRIDLNSTAGAGTTWNLILNGSYSCQYLDVQGSNASGTVSFPIDPIGSLDSGDNTNWFPLAKSDDTNILRLGADRHTFYDGTYYWIFYIDSDANVVYKKSTNGQQWSSSTIVSSGDYKSLGIWEDGTYIWCAYSDSANSYERRITIANGNLADQRTLTSVSHYHPQLIKSASDYLHRKAEIIPGGIYKVYNYNGNMGANSSLNVNITPVSNLKRAFILGPAGKMSVGRGAGGAQQNADQVLMRARFNSISQVQINRGTNTNDSYYSFYVIEEATGSDIYVVSGTSAFADNTDADLTITPTDVPDLANITDPSKCVVFLTVSSNSASVSYYNQAHVRGWLDTSRNVQLRRTAGNSIVTVNWFVVEFRGSSWSIQQGDFSLTTGTDTSPQTQTIASVNLNNSFVFMNWQATNNGLEQTSAKVELYDSTTLRFSRRTTTAGTCNIRWFVLSHPDIRVQRGTDFAGSSDASEDQAITQVDTTRAFPITFNDSSSTGTTFPRCYWRARLSNSTTLYWDRSYTTSSGYFKWQVIEFPRGFYWMRSTNPADDSAWNTEEKLAEDTDGIGHCSLVPLTTNNIMAIYNDYDAGTYNLRYRVYNGTTWNSEATVVSDCQDSLNFSNWSDTHYFSAVSDNVGYVYVIYTDTGGNIKYTFYNGSSWSATQTVSDAAGCSHPSLFYDAKYETLYAFWLQGNELKYKRFTGNWAAPATTLKTGLVSPTCLGVAYQDTDNIGVCWRQGTSSPYSANYATLGIVTTIVNLSEFYSLGLDTKTKVFWRTESEVNNAGFNLYRSEKPDTDYLKINSGLIPGLGTSSIGREYEYMDTTVTPGKTYYYILESVEFNGLNRKFGPVIAHPGIDSDADGMSDDYEYFYGLDPNLNDTGLDPDNDGFTNLQEYQNTTDPYSAPFDLLSWQASQPLPGPGITVISSNDSEIVLELVTNKFDTTTKLEAAQTYHKVSLGDYSHAYTDEIGKPQLPLKSVLLQMSDKKPLNLTVLEYDRQQLSGYNIYPVPQRVLVTQADTIFLASQFYKNDLIYNTNDYYPYKLAEIDYSSYLRDQQVVKLRFYPFQFNPVTGAVDFYHRLRIKLSIQQAPSPSPLSTGGNGLPQATASAFKIMVNQDGVYRITYSDLINAGLNVGSLNPKNFKLYSKGTQIPIYVYGEDDNIFNETDYIEFYAIKENTRYTYTNVYWLSFTLGQGLRMENKSCSAGTTPLSFLYTHHFEQNQNYWMESAQEDPWFFLPQISAGASHEFTTDLIDVVNSPQDCIFIVSLRGCKWGNSDVTHHLRLYLNNHIIGDAKWLNNQAHKMTLTFASYWLKQGNNTIKVSSIVDTPADNNGLVLADWFDISYWRLFKAKDSYLEFGPSGVGAYTYTVTNFSDSDIRVYDITEHNNVKKISGLSIEQEGLTFKVSFNDLSAANSKYATVCSSGAKIPIAIVPEEVCDLRSALNQADYIIITCDNFYNEIMPLAKHRQKQGLVVKTVKLSDVYDEFNYGISSPYPIKYFLNYCYTSWKKPAPTYVLLVGDATYDLRDDEGTGFANYLPTFLFYNQDFGETASDDWFACLDSDTDIFPEMLVGRFPAKTPQEVINMVNKTIAYENVDLKELWTKRAVFVADNSGVFESISDTLAGQLTDNFLRFKLYLAGYGNPNTAKQDIIQNINQGCLLLNYTGHAGIQLWAEENIFSNNDIGLLNNKDKYPFVITLNCVNGYFIQPMFFECLAEELLRPAEKGAVCVLAPSGMSLTTHQQILAEGIYDALFKQQEYILGSAVAKGKLYLFQEAADTAPEALRQFILFGDPCLILRKEAPVVSQPTQPSVYTSIRGIRSLYSLNISTDISKLYPSILFEPELERSLAKEKPRDKKPLKPKEKITVKEHSSLIDRLTRPSLTKQEPDKELKLTYSFENKIVRLGPILSLEKKEIIEPRPVTELRELKGIPLSEPQETQKPKPLSLWQKIIRAISNFFKQ